MTGRDAHAVSILENLRARKTLGSGSFSPTCGCANGLQHPRDPRYARHPSGDSDAAGSRANRAVADVAWKPPAETTELGPIIMSRLSAQPAPDCQESALWLGFCPNLVMHDRQGCQA